MESAKSNYPDLGRPKQPPALVRRGGHVFHQRVARHPHASAPGLHAVFTPTASLWRTVTFESTRIIDHGARKSPGPEAPRERILSHWRTGKARHLRQSYPAPAQKLMICRRTGVTLAERQRDEHGFEDLDGVFSSPEKSPPKRDNATAADKTLTSEDMDLQQSMSDSDDSANSPTNGAFNALVEALLDDNESNGDTETDSRFAGSMPEPADALSARKSIRFPPPLGRSPIKTSLGSSPRRQSSMGPPSMRRATKSPDRASSHPAVARKLDFSSIDDFSDRDGSSASRNKGSARRSIYDIEPSPDPEQEPTQEDTVADDEELPGEDEIPANGFEDESLVPVEGGDSLPAIEDEVDDATEEPSEIPAAKPRRGAGRPRQSIEKAAKPTKDQEEPAEQPAKRAPGRPKKSKALASVQASNASSALGPRAARRGRLATNGDVSAVSVSENEPDVEEPSLPEVEETASEVTEPQAKKRGRPKGTGSKTARPIAQDADESSVQEVEETGAEAVQVTQSKKRGRPKGSGQKATANAAEPEPSVADEEERPSKRSKKDAAPAAKPATKKNSAQGKAKGKATARASSVNPPTAVQRQASMPPPPPPRDAKSSHILRATTPFDDSDVKTTRSGRASVKPLAYYLGEKIEYSHDRQNLGIIRAEDNELPKRSRRGPSKGKKRKGAASAASEEPELPLEPWEKGAGIIAGYLNEWDDKKGISLEESAQQQGEFLRPVGSFEIPDIVHRHCLRSEQDTDKRCGRHGISLCQNHGNSVHGRGYGRHSSEWHQAQEKLSANAHRLLRAGRKGHRDSWRYSVWDQQGGCFRGAAR